MRIRLKDGYPLSKMNTPYGVVTHEWKDFKEGVYIYKEMEVEGVPEKLTPIKVIEPKPIVPIDLVPPKIIVPVIPPEVPVVPTIEKKVVVKLPKNKGR